MTEYLITSLSLTVSVKDLTIDYYVRNCDKT